MRHADFRIATSPVEERFIQLSTEVLLHCQNQEVKIPPKGPFWCSNLCVADPTFLVPILVGFFFAANVWISGKYHENTSDCLTILQPPGNRLSKATEHLPSRGQTIFTTLLYSISALMVKPLAACEHFKNCGCQGSIGRLSALCCGYLLDDQWSHGCSTKSAFDGTKVEKSWNFVKPWPDSISQVSSPGQDPVSGARASEAVPTTEGKFLQNLWNENQINIFFSPSCLEAVPHRKGPRQCAASGSRRTTPVRGI